MRRSLVCFLADTTSSAANEFPLLAFGVALEIVLGLMQLGGEGRAAAPMLLRLRNQ